jgi:hypothetical protein
MSTISDRMKIMTIGVSEWNVPASFRNPMKRYSASIADRQGYSCCEQHDVSYSVVNRTAIAGISNGSE